MEGSLLLPGIGAEESVVIQDQDKLVIPESPELGVSANTAMFFINYLEADGQSDNIAIEVT
jgi:hypothetical protein